MKLGHDVTLFASGDLQTAAKLEPMWPRSLRLDDTVRDPMALHIAMLEQVRRRAGEFDILHFHLDYFPFSVFSRQSTPFITTMHGRLDLPEHQTVFNAFSVGAGRLDFRRPAPAVAAGTLAKTVHHGLPAGLLEPRAVKPDYLGFPRPHRAGEGASTGRSASLCDATCRSRSRPRSTASTATISSGRSGRCWLCRASSTSARSAIGTSPTFLSGARALLMPIDWPEPFGLVMIEAMACGTPVIAYGSGSVPEVVEHGLTGFIVDSEVAAAEVIDNQLRAALAPEDSRALRGAFHRPPHGGDYVAIYRELIAAAKRPLRTVNGSAKPNARSQDGRHQTGIDGGLYIGD